MVELNKRPLYKGLIIPYIVMVKEFIDNELKSKATKQP